MSAENLLIGEAARRLQLTEAKLRRLCLEGIVVVPRVGGMLAFPADLDAIRAAVAPHVHDRRRTARS